MFQSQSDLVLYIYAESSRVRPLNNERESGENLKAWFPYGHNGRKNRVTIFLNGQFIIVYTCKPDINNKYSLVIIMHSAYFQFQNVVFRLMRKIR